MSHVITSQAQPRFETNLAGDASISRAYLDGASRMVPWLVGVVPYGLVLGAVVSAGPASTTAGLLGAPMIFGGSAHLAVLDLIEALAPLLIVCMTVLVVQSRLALYSASLAPHWKNTSWQFRALATAMIIDPTYAVGLEIYREHDGPAGHRRFLGAGLLLALGWFLAIAAGFLMGSRVPEGLHLMAVPLVLLGHVVVMCRDRKARTTALVAAAASVIATGAPLHLGLLVGIVVGVAWGDSIEPEESP